MRMSSKYFQKRIEELQQKIAEGSDNVESMKKELERLKVLEFEESIKDESEMQLLKG
jgi:predicted RNase H-like nuclease (RuvC/YqgF family)